MIKLPNRFIIYLLLIIPLAVVAYGIYLVFLQRAQSTSSTISFNSPEKISPDKDVLAKWLIEHTFWQQQGTNTGWAGFDKVYFITMPDRLDNVTAVAERLGIANSAWILKAINKSSIDAEELAKLNIIDPNYFKTLMPKPYGVVGCQLSHLAVLLDCYRDTNAKTCVIFEDDIYRPAKEVTAQVIDFRQRIEKLQVSWDMLFLDYCMERGSGKVQDDIRWLTGSFCGHAYVVKRDIVPLLLLEDTPIIQPIDGTYFSLIRDERIVAIGPDKARYFAQNRYGYDSYADPGFIENPQLVFRYK